MLLGRSVLPSVCIRTGGLLFNTCDQKSVSEKNSAAVDSEEQSSKQGSFSIENNNGPDDPVSEEREYILFSSKALTAS